MERIDPFIDGAAVKKVGNYTFEICRKFLDGMITVEAGETCSTILQLYNEAIVAEPAGGHISYRFKLLYK